MKEESMQDDHDRDAWLRPLLSQSMPAASGDCLDADTLAAWSDGALDAGRAADVERHASTCARCMALVASMARTAPPPLEAQPERAWALAPMLRWLVPLTAAATAIAIYVLLPDRPVTSVLQRPAPSGVEEPAPSARQESAPSTPAPVETPGRELRAPEAAPPVIQPSQPAREPQARSDAAADNQAVPDRMRRDTDASTETRQERAFEAFAPPVESLRDQAAVPSPAAPPPAAPSAPAAPPAATEPVTPPAAAPSSRAAAAAGTQRFTAETVKEQMAQQQALARAVPTSESTAPSDPLVQWRVFAWVAVERSIDGGKTWIKTTTPPGVTPNNPPTVWIVSIRAVDNLRAVVLTTARREFYTTNGGMSWERVQENSAAPF
jgi:hypothetical protein